MLELNKSSLSMPEIKYVSLKGDLKLFPTQTFGPLFPCLRPLKTLSHMYGYIAEKLANKTHIWMFSTF